MLRPPITAGGGGARIHVDTRDPINTDDFNAGFSVGDLWYNSVTTVLFECRDSTVTAAVWKAQSNLAHFDYLVGPVGFARFQGIQAAIDQAVTDGHSRTNPTTVGTLEGTYVENVGLKAGVSLAAVAPNLPARGSSPAVSVLIQGTLTFDISDAAPNLYDNYLYNIRVAPTTGSAVVLKGTAYKRLGLFGSTLSSNDADAVDFSANASPGEYITQYKCRNTTLGTAKRIAQINSGQSFVAYKSAFISIFGDSFDLNGGILFIDGTVGTGEDEMFGPIEILTGSSGSKLIMRHIDIDSTAAHDVKVEGSLDTALNQTYFDAVYRHRSGVPRGTPIRITGTNASQFKELPESAVAGDAKQYDGQQWQLAQIATYDYLVGPVGKARFTSVQAAIDQAVADGHDNSNPTVVGILEGIYTENVNLKPGISCSAVTARSPIIGSDPLVPVVIVGSLTYDHTDASSTSHQIELHNIKVTPATGSAFIFKGTARKRIEMYGGIALTIDADVADYSENASPSEYIVLYKSKVETQDNTKLVAKLNPGQAFTSYKSALFGRVDGHSFQLNGGSLRVYGIRFTEEDVIYGAIEVLAGTMNVLTLDQTAIASTLTYEIKVEGQLIPSPIFARISETYSTLYGTPIRITGTNAAQLKETPTAAVDGDIKRYDGQQWQLTQLPALDGDYDIPALTTTGDNQIAMSPTIQNTPENDVIVRVNHVSYKPARDQSEKPTSPCYFSGDGGGTVTPIGSVIGGVDKLYWVGSVAGFQLSPTDRIDLVYET